VVLFSATNNFRVIGYAFYLGILYTKILACVYCFLDRKACVKMKFVLANYTMLAKKLYLNAFISYLTDCFFLSWLSVNSGCAEGGVRLAGGESEMEGRVEVCHNQTWWAVSASYNWNIRDATVVCKHLHYPSNSKLTCGIQL